MEERSYKRFAEACLETSIVLYVDRLLTQVSNHQFYYIGATAVTRAKMERIYNPTEGYSKNLIGTFCVYLQKVHIKEETLKRLEVDEVVLGEFFREIITPAVSQPHKIIKFLFSFLSKMCLVTCLISDGCVYAKQKVDKRILPLAELRDLASAESVDSFTEAYLKLLENHPDCPVENLALSFLDIPIL